MKSLLWIAMTTLGATVCAAAACGGGVSTDTGGTGASGAGGSTTSGTTATTGDSGTSTSGNGGGSASTGGGGSASVGSGGSGGGAMGGCNPACGVGLLCCGNSCINPSNDINNCGACGTVCAGPFPFCDNGTCGKAPCDAGAICSGTTTCCGSQCCKPGEICCVVQAGPVGPPMCVKPNDKGTCDVGCPGCVCASPDTPIATPDGERAIADLAVGDLVYSVDAGRVVVAPIVRINRAAVVGHHVVRVSLASGRAIEISAPHPTGDGRTFGDLRPGDTLHGAAVIDVSVVPYHHEFTYDVLPASDTGAYFAGGALVGSTLATEPALAPDASFNLP